MDLTPWMEHWHMLPEPGGIVLCGVSGGIPSVCWTICISWDSGGALPPRRDI